MKILIAILIIIPTMEIWGLITAGKAFGWLPTLFMIIFTGMLGAWLAKRQGLQVWQRTIRELQHGGIPGDALLDGVVILAGGLLLLTPGFFTDLIGFLCLIPTTRGIFKLLLIKWLWKNFQNGRFVIHGGNWWRR
ncbi:FxsA family protein [Ammoniphilus resinae]|uniref:UPF0716 protein FxsA n=1 Tax=Ammoniphilus resinae TaxID=861532 RepID=A0ABS4GLP6_9BACL|nr:FxsA family protein [Ammoniphilus resinae]MBP1931193.1 UPF0716 protein FxsA [Ammoniphilus resinae]